MWHRVAASPSMRLLAMTSAFIVGIAAHAFDERAWLAAGVGGAAAVAAVFAAAVMFRRWPAAGLAAACVACAVGAAWRYDSTLARVRPDVAPPPGDARFQGIVVEEPRMAVSGTIVVVDAGDARAELRYRVPVDVAAGETIAWRCRMRPRDPATRVRFRRDVAWTCMPSEEPVRIASPPPVRAAMHAARAHVRETVTSALPEPDASLVLGLLIGDDGGIPRSVAQAFRETGAAHVLAVSGYNVRLLVDALFTAFAAVSVRRRRASAAVAALVVAFAAMTGAEPPVVRAAVMGCAGIVAGFLGRRDAGVGSLLLAAAAMLAVDPSALRHDVGFRLSFAAVAGMRVFGPRFYRAFGGDPDEFGVRRSLADTLAATCATLPIVLHDFGTVPFAAPLVNVVIAPFVPSLMAAGAAVLAFGTASSALATVPATLCVALARPFVAIVTRAAAFAPAAHFKITAAQMACAYAAMLAASCWPRRRIRVAPPPPPDAVVTTYAR